MRVCIVASIEWERGGFKSTRRNNAKRHFLRTTSRLQHLKEKSAQNSSKNTLYRCVGCKRECISPAPPSLALPAILLQPLPCSFAIAVAGGPLEDAGRDLELYKMLMELTLGDQKVLHLDSRAPK